MMIGVAGARERDQRIAHRRGQRLRICTASGAGPRQAGVVEHQRNVQGMKGAQPAFFHRRSPLQLIRPGGRRAAGLARTRLQFLQRTAPGPPGGGGGEKHFRRRVVRVQAPVLGDHRLRQQIDELLAFQLRRQGVPRQGEVGRIIAEQRTGLVAGIADHHRNAGRLPRCLRPERMDRQADLVQYRPEVQRRAFHP
ncbi:hypothetical protein G6F40_014825 [Rhizopus arrhizus]|nr:hypothetical protein G6F40_014825 [Rhizopus arrhizus]